MSGILGGSFTGVMGGLMARTRLSFLLIALFACFNATLAHASVPLGCDKPTTPRALDATHPLNLGQLKLQIIHYRCTRYDTELAKVAHRATLYMEHRAPHVHKPALVLDIDETSLSNWDNIFHNDFAYIVGGDCDLLGNRACGQVAWEHSTQAPAIAPTLALFKAAKSMNVAVFFITGRHDVGDERAITEENLHKVGYDGWEHLYLRPDTSREASVAPYKTAMRSDVEQQGYTIIANVGDQWSDLIGGHAERRFKLPNPFYYLK
jgi:hypothetical protein